MLDNTSNKTKEFTMQCAVARSWPSHLLLIVTISSWALPR